MHALTLVLGGARSGKSRLAESMVAAAPPPVTYLATASADSHDTDWTARVAAHRDRRPSAWLTVEAGASLVAHLEATSGTVLVDSLGTWIAAHPDLDADAGALVAALRARRDRGEITVVVSEEVGLGVHPASDVGRRFRDALGSVNQAVADVADRAVLVVAGRTIPLERWAP